MGIYDGVYQRDESIAPVGTEVGGVKEEPGVDEGEIEPAELTRGCVHVEGRVNAPGVKRVITVMHAYYRYQLLPYSRKIWRGIKFGG